MSSRRGCESLEPAFPVVQLRQHQREWDICGKTVTKDARLEKHSRANAKGGVGLSCVQESYALILGRVVEAGRLTYGTGAGPKNLLYSLL